MDDDIPQMLPPEQYTELLAHLAQVARTVAQQGKDIMPMAFLIKDGKITDVVGSSFEDETVKDGFAETVRQRASKTQPDAIALLSEAWSLPKEYQTPEKVAEHRKNYKQIADAPYKTDIVMLKLETREGDWLGRTEIVKTETARSFGALAWMEADGTSGRFTHLLPVVYATPQQVKQYVDMARRKLLDVGVDPDYVMDTGDSISACIEANSRQAPAAKLTEELLDILISGAVICMRNNRQ